MKQTREVITPRWTDMDGVLAFVLIATLIALPLAVLDTAALRWGADSRDPLPDDHRR